MDFSLDLLITLLVIGGSISVLILTRWAPDVVLIAGVVALMLSGVLEPAEALAGMSNEGMLTVGVLYVVAQGLIDTGVVAALSQGVLGRPRSVRHAQFRLVFPVAAFSSVLNNTPVVAMFMPAVADLAKRFRMPVSQLMMPLSFAAIAGGLCTLVGTSTNLIVDGMFKEHTGGNGIGMFDLAWVGVPCVLVVAIYTLLTAQWLLPKRIGARQRFEDARQYIVEMLLEPYSPLAGKTIEEAGLRHLPGVYLVEIERENRLITAVSPSETLCANDRLVFAGDVESVVDLQKIRGVRPAEDQIFKLDSPRADRCLVEVVISASFPGLRRTVRDMQFRNRYGAAIIAVSRAGKQLREKIGDIRLEPGDTLLMETHQEFVQQQKYSRDFLLVSRVENSQPPRHERRWLAIGILLTMVIAVAVGALPMLHAAMLAAGLMIVTRCTTGHSARQAVDWQVLLLIAASIALGRAVEKTGIAHAVAAGTAELVHGSPMLTNTIFFAVTALFTSMISNVAAAALMFPLVVATATALGASLTPFVITLMVASSACFATPISYQTNLMVYGPGDYRFSDFVRFGLPLTLLVALATLVIVPLVWPFYP